MKKEEFIYSREKDKNSVRFRLQNSKDELPVFWHIGYLITAAEEVTQKELMDFADGNHDISKALRSWILDFCEYRKKMDSKSNVTQPQKDQRFLTVLPGIKRILEQIDKNALHSNTKDFTFDRWNLVETLHGEGLDIENDWVFGMVTKYGVKAEYLELAKRKMILKIVEESILMCVFPDDYKYSQ